MISHLVEEGIGEAISAQERRRSVRSLLAGQGILQSAASQSSCCKLWMSTHVPFLHDLAHSDAL